MPVDRFGALADPLRRVIWLRWRAAVRMGEPSASSHPNSTVAPTTALLVVLGTKTPAGQQSDWTPRCRTADQRPRGIGYTRRYVRAVAAHCRHRSGLGRRCLGPSSGRLLPIRHRRVVVSVDGRSARGSASELSTANLVPPLGGELQAPAGPVRLAIPTKQAGPPKGANLLTGRSRLSDAY